MRGIGGSERHLLTLLPALRRYGVDPLFVGLDDPTSAPQPFYDELEDRGIRFVRLRSERDLDPGAAVALARALRTIRPELVHTHLVHADVYGALTATMRLVSTKHNDDPFRLGPYRYLERVLARRFGRVIAITESLRRFTVERVGLPAAKVEVVHYGLDEPPRGWAPNTELSVPPRAPVLLAVCRLTEQKGIDVAVRALPAIRAEHPAAVLVVLGEGEERARLEELARGFGVADALFLPGRVGDVAAWYRRADLLVHPARWEGFGLVLLEAMLSELPVVATRVSSIPEIVVDGETGYLVQPDDAPALAAAVGRVLESPGTLGRAGRERARAEFSVARMASRTAAVYERV